MTFLIALSELRPARGAGVQPTAARPRAARAPDADDRELAGYLFFRRNVNGWQTEWWLHRDGCRRWFLAERHTSTNEIRRTFWPTEREESPA